MNIICAGQPKFLTKKELVYNNSSKTPLNFGDHILYNECRKALDHALDGLVTKYIDVNFIAKNLFSYYHSGMFKVLNSVEEVQKYPIKLGLEINFYAGMEKEPNNHDCIKIIQKKLKEYFQKKAFQEHHATGVNHVSNMNNQHISTYWSDYSGYLIPEYNKAVYFYQDTQSFCLNFGDKDFANIDNMFPPEKIKLFREYVNLKEISKETLQKNSKKISL